MTDYFSKHKDRLERAVEACATRQAWTPFVESPSRKLHPDGAKQRGLEAFRSYLNQPFPVEQPGEVGRVGEEVSPYTGEPLGTTYPGVDIDALFTAMDRAKQSWQTTSVETRIGLCMEILERLSQNVFANTYATMHTSGQAFMMAFAGSGANSLDRGLEAIVYAYKAMRDVPTETTFERRFGKEPVRLKKRYRLLPRGIAVVIACGSYPAWNAYPAMFANLATGNPVVLKPHPNGILPVAMTVQIARDVLSEAGVDPNLVTLAADTPDAPVTKKLVEHERTAIVDFTGSQSFGSWLEQNCRHADVYTETSGCNAVVIESTSDLAGLLHAVTHSVALFSSQMCTAAQNIFVPETIETDRGTVTFDAFCAAFVDTMDELLADPSHAAAICGAIHSVRTLENIEQASALGVVLRDSTPYTHPEFASARTATPLVLQVDAAETGYRQERFGPIAFLIRCKDAEEALQRATEDARTQGSIANYLYSNNPDFLERGIDAFNSAGSSVGCNLIGHLPINFTAAFSDFHVTGLNPAGNATLTDLSFVTRRFRVVQSKVEVSE